MSTAPIPATARVLLNMLSMLLAPLFLEASGNNFALARAAALETLAEFHASSGADMLLAAQIIAFSLGSVSTLLQSMADDVTPEAAHRMQATANSLGRTAETCRKALVQTRRAPPPLDLPDPGEVLAEFLERTRRPPAQPAPASPATAARTSAAPAAASPDQAARTPAAPAPTSPASTSAAPASRPPASPAPTARTPAQPVPTSVAPAARTPVQPAPTSPVPTVTAPTAAVQPAPVQPARTQATPAQPASAQAARPAPIQPAPA